jgi:hypothetical protein
MNAVLLADLETFGFVTVTYTTNRGTVRVMHCTRRLADIPENVRSGINDPKLNGPLICCVYDWQNSGFRAFRWDSVIEWNSHD